MWILENRFFFLYLRGYLLRSPNFRYLELPIIRTWSFKLPGVDSTLPKLPASSGEDPGDEVDSFPPNHLSYATAPCRRQISELS